MPFLTKYLLFMLAMSTPLFALAEISAGGRSGGGISLAENLTEMVLRNTESKSVDIRISANVVSAIKVFVGDLDSQLCLEGEDLANGNVVLPFESRIAVHANFRSFYELDFVLEDTVFFAPDLIVWNDVNLISPPICEILEPEKGRWRCVGTLPRSRNQLGFRLKLRAGLLDKCYKQPLSQVRFLVFPLP